MKRSLLAMLLLSQLGQSATAEQPPEWAKDAVDTVEKRGIMQGYPDGSLGGERPVKRDELAEMIERLDQERLREEEAYATQSDLDQTRDLTTEVTNQINDLDTRVENLENNSDVLDQRRDEVRRPGF